MVCKSCRSENQRKFNSEINVHLSGLKNLDKQPVFIFPKLLVCMDCGFAEFAIPETELYMLGDSAVPGTRTSSTLDWSSDLSEFAARLPINRSGIEVREPAADKLFALKDGFYRQ